MQPRDRTKDKVAWLVKSPTLLRPVLVWSQFNYQRLWKTVRYFESTWACCPRDLPERKSRPHDNEGIKLDAHGMRPMRFLSACVWFRDVTSFSDASGMVCIRVKTCFYIDASDSLLWLTFTRTQTIPGASEKDVTSRNQTHAPKKRIGHTRMPCASSSWVVVYVIISSLFNHKPHVIVQIFTEFNLNAVYRKETF